MGFRSPDLERRPQSSHGAPAGVGPRRLERADLVPLGIGFGIGAVVAAVPILNWVCSYLGILAHELGHFLAGMVFGYPSIPAFDLRQGGGITLHQDRSWLLLAGVYVAALLPFLRLRRNPPAAAVWGGAVLLFALVAHTRLHELVILAAGHVTEVVLGGVFLYRAWANASIQTPAELGLFLVWRPIVFSIRILHDAGARAEYLAGKIDCDNDFVRISSLTGIRMDAWLWMLIVLSAATAAASFLAFRYRRIWMGWARWLAGSRGG